MAIERPIAPAKVKIDDLIDEDHGLTKLIYSYLISATAWLIFGTLVGLYLAIRFIYPDFGVAAWLSFGRLRPIHTNVVFWGWTSLAMIALALYVVPRTSQRPLFSIKLARQALYVINASILIGVTYLFLGYNNGGQEYREFIWPAMLLFALGLLAHTLNFYKTIALRGTKEIYISNWYILAAFLWTIVVVVIAYLPWYQDGLGETVIQGYYMHMGVGMWFTPLVLGLTYYFIPMLLNKPIYSYSLGVLAFWTQMVFYSLIGAHHFVFSPTPWWLQTVAIVFSFGMIITLAAGTGNFLLTMKGSFRKVARSYSLPFILVGVIFYFLASAQGSFEALRELNQLWHFTNYTVAHSHLTMYGFVVFLIWGGIYALLPRLTGKEPSHLLIGIHFWFAFLGLMIYGFALMIGGTMQGKSWIDELPFIHSVELMLPYWIWRAIGGTFMFTSHIIFAYNLYKMKPTTAAIKNVDYAGEQV
ncbi:MAG: cbb3-type cytochrome c oxidase subunit I [Ignavibacteriaceae bacterium]|nr:cbb3-type cytochrome c oxidase subunit I [Ignavibacterium sp.]MCC6254788.1 cbb3-type cytochrome c oxidase subunit I [Ignavibacteriaceae bacterium]HRN26420.1 cbb3-type cytochrome c oxidase subunit I [Ignavibacteriaceae bacterium]HRQ54053.1 cbb3-type cytochrome c oxidase subunit I [Ignavibacteriaceae bacterium]